LVFEFLFLVSEGSSQLKLLTHHRGVFLFSNALEFVFEDLEVGRRRGVFDSDSGGRLVDEVDRLIRKEAVLNETAGKLDGGEEGFVGDGDTVVGLVAVAEALQYIEGVFDGRFLYEHRLEPAFEGRVFLYVFFEFVISGGADALKLAAGESGFEYVRRVDRALGRARADYRVQFVYEKDDVALRLVYLVHDAF